MEHFDLKAFFCEHTGLPNGIKQLRPAKPMSELPRIIENQYDLKQTEILGLPFLFAIPKHNEIEIKKLMTHLKILKIATKIPIVFLFKSLKSYQSKTLVTNKINFIDLNGNIYLPDALLILRKTKEKFTFEKPERLSQWAKITIIKQILTKDLNGLTISDLADRLNISIMHASRLVIELKSFGILQIEQQGVRKHLQFLPKLALWEKTNELLGSPLVKRIYTDTKITQGKLAGLTALGELTLIDGGQLQTKAISKKDFSLLQKKIVPTAKENAIYCIEIWEWDPVLLTTNNFADTVSLYLSLKNDEDDRIQIALKELLRTILGEK